MTEEDLEQFVTRLIDKETQNDNGKSEDTIQTKEQKVL